MSKQISAIDVIHTVTRLLVQHETASAYSIICCCN